MTKNRFTAVLFYCNNVRFCQVLKKQKVRTLKIDEVSYFVGKDVAEILGYSNTRKALQDHVDLEDKKDGVTIRYPLDDIHFS